MCTLLVDIEIETGSVAADTDDVVPVQCSTGRVIVAATAYIANGTGSGVDKWPVAVILADGTLTNEAGIETAGAGVGHGASTLFYALTTGRLAEL